MQKLKILNTFDNLEQYNNEKDNITDNELSCVPFIPNITDQDAFIDNVMDKLINKGNEGQLLTSKNGILDVKNPVEFYQLVDSEEDLDYSKNNRVTFKTVFDNWYRFAHYNNQQNIPSYDSIRNKWTYNASDESIRSNINWDGYMGFINPEPNNNWQMTVKITGADTDDDGVAIVIGFTTDENGIEHTLSVIRSGGTNVTSNLWFLVYDFRMATENRMVLKGNTVNGATWQGRYALVKVTRTGESFVAETTNINSTTFVENSRIEYTLPSSKPSSMAQEQYDNIKKMLTGPSQMGFACVSENGIFTLIEQNIIKDVLIYDLINNQILEFKNGSWTVTGSVTDNLPNYSIIFNKLTKKLFYYENGIATCLIN